MATIETNRQWFIDKTRDAAMRIVDDEENTSEHKRHMLFYYAAQLDGASLMVEGEPEFFRACCDLRNQILKWRDRI